MWPTHSDHLFLNIFFKKINGKRGPLRIWPCASINIALNIQSILAFIFHKFLEENLSDSTLKVWIRPLKQRLYDRGHIYDTRTVFQFCKPKPERLCLSPLMLFWCCKIDFTGRLTSSMHAISVMLSTDGEERDLMSPH